RIGSAVPVRKAAKAEGEEEAGPPVLLAERWDNEADLAGWWMSEKLDGVRAYWDGAQFLSRQGNRYQAPDWFVAGLPPTPLDGEGRSTTLLKVKTFRDAEARVVEHQPGAGRHKGRLGALGVELPDGTRFAVGTGFSDAERDDPPPLGSVITFRYQELSE